MSKKFKKSNLVQVIDFQKGDIVEITGRVFVSKANYHRSMYTHDFSTNVKHYGIIIGYSFIQTGKLVAGLVHKPTYNKVWVIEPLTHGKRYIKPYRCLNSQIKKVKSTVWDK